MSQGAGWTGVEILRDIKEQDEDGRKEGNYVNCDTSRDIIKIFFQLIFALITHHFLALLPVWRFSRAVCELPCHQPLIAAHCKLRPHQEASIVIGKAVHFEQRGHRRQG